MNDKKDEPVNAKALTALETAEAFAIENADQYLAADQMCAGLKGLEKEVDEGYDEPIRKAREAHLALVAKKKGYLAPIEAARRILKDKMAAWQEKMERKRLALEAELREQQKQKAEDEALAAAAEAEKAGDKTQAEAILSQPVIVAPIVLPKMAPKTETTFQTRWAYRIINADAIPRGFLTPDTQKIGQVVRAMKGATNIPGIEVFSQKV